ncbi:hypothetical protein RR46_09877 [Papilio xuthus]|uniref:Claudin domain-containing protein 1 n=1 Tax=Papilio xuthus TaxID=66420 RepID=A0A194QB68_PAPXU|nr:hypothetical protein RR46_09877 [Papilio xuthus]
MPCSAVTLSIATITAIVAAALMAIAFSTDNWLYIEVKRSNIQSYVTSNTDNSQAILESLNNKYYFYTRTRGLFRVCYPKERPPTVEIYLSPVETHCSNVDYFIPDENNETKGFSDDAMNRLHMARSTVALFIVAFLVLFIAFWTGVVGCWKRSPGNITATAILMLVTCLLSAGAMALWHGVEFYEKEKVVGEEYYQQWPNVLKDNSAIWYDWSYILAWLAVGVSFGSSILFFSAAICLSKEKRREQQNNVQYIMPGQTAIAAAILPTSRWLINASRFWMFFLTDGGLLVYLLILDILRDNARVWYDWSYIVAWCGVGLSLLSAILFSSAAICLRGEREREEALNMQYLMPVYPQKQQYAYAGYPPPQAYPGPYYHGSQYGPYNY